MNNMNWYLKYRGTIFGLYQAVAENGKVFEEVRRTPGVRLLITNDQDEILLNQEKRRTLGYKVDHRLPGGKVFDSINDAETYRNHPDLGGYVIDAAIREAREEIGLDIQAEDCEIFAQDQYDGKVEFDLYFVAVRRFTILDSGPEFADSEHQEIVGWQWHDYKAAKHLALDYQKFSEGRSARMLLSFLCSKED